jgi:hypothetical protein
MGAIIAVVLLLLPQATNHHTATLFFLLVPIFLILEPVAASVRYPPRKDRSHALSGHVRYTLFPRPPPSQA